MKKYSFVCQFGDRKGERKIERPIEKIEAVSIYEAAKEIGGTLKKRAKIISFSVEAVSEKPEKWKEIKIVGERKEGWRAFQYYKHAKNNVKPLLVFDTSGKQQSWPYPRFLLYSL